MHSEILNIYLARYPCSKVTNILVQKIKGKKCIFHIFCMVTLNVYMIYCNIVQTTKYLLFIIKPDLNALYTAVYP